MTVMVARSTALDQYVVEHPEFLFDRSPEEARIDPDNLYVLVDHVKCAAFELPPPPPPPPPLPPPPLAAAPPKAPAAGGIWPSLAARARPISVNPRP